MLGRKRKVQCKLSVCRVQEHATGWVTTCTYELCRFGKGIEHGRGGRSCEWKEARAADDERCPKFGKEAYAYHTFSFVSTFADI